MWMNSETSTGKCNIASVSFNKRAVRSQSTTKGKAMRGKNSEDYLLP